MFTVLSIYANKQVEDAVMMVCVCVVAGCGVCCGCWRVTALCEGLCLCRGPVSRSLFLSLFCNGSEMGGRGGGGGEHLLLIALPLSLVDLLQWKSADEITGPAGPSTTIAESESVCVCVCVCLMLSVFHLDPSILHPCVICS